MRIVANKIRTRSDARGYLCHSTSGTAARVSQQFFWCNIGAAVVCESDAEQLVRLAAIQLASQRLIKDRERCLMGARQTLDGSVCRIIFLCAILYNSVDLR